MDETDIEYSARITHDNIPMAHGNESNNQLGKFYLEYFIYIET